MELSNKFKQLQKSNIRIQVSEDEILRRIEQIESMAMDDELQDFLISALAALVNLDHIIGLKETTITKLRKIFEKKVEKKVPPKKEDEGNKKKRGNNQGRNGKEDYPNAQHVNHPHKDLKKGDACPECQDGKLTPRPSGIYIRITGSPTLKPTIHNTEKLRCNICGKIFEATFDGKNASKYDAKAIAAIALLKYAASIPFYRLEKIQKTLGVPMPASTQWDLMEKLVNDVWPVWQEILKNAAQGQLFFIDDTKGKVQSLLQENKKMDKNDKKQRKGIFTTCIRSCIDEGEITLYFTGRRYSGENLDAILSERADKGPPIVMSDASHQNNLKVHEVLKAYCLVHSRRKFFELGEKFEEESKFVVDLIEKIYEVESQAKILSPEERLLLHQKYSGPLMEQLREWGQAMFDLKKVEPNSSLGKAINYFLKHYEQLSGFLKLAGAPIDSNAVERDLKLAVLNRKNWLFYRSEMGALAGDVIMSILKTCGNIGINGFDFFVWIQENTAQVKQSPSEFVPWKFKK